MSLKGIPTGGPESGSIANLVVYFLLEKVLFVHPRINPLNKISSRKRFLDDLWFGWMGTERQFTSFKKVLNEVGDDLHGITFKGDVSKSVDFLDATITLKQKGKISTSLYHIRSFDSVAYACLLRESESIESG